MYFLSQISSIRVCLLQEPSIGALWCEGRHPSGLSLLGNALWLVLVSRAGLTSYLYFHQRIRYWVKNNFLIYEMTRVPYRKITHFSNFICLALVIAECIVSTSGIWIDIVGGIWIDFNQFNVGIVTLSLASSTLICVSVGSFPCNWITLLNAMLSDLVVANRYVSNWQVCRLHDYMYIVVGYNHHRWHMVRGVRQYNCSLHACFHRQHPQWPATKSAWSEFDSNLSSTGAEIGWARRGASLSVYTLQHSFDAEVQDYQLFRELDAVLR